MTDITQVMRRTSRLTCTCYIFMIQSPTRLCKYSQRIPLIGLLSSSAGRHLRLDLSGAPVAWAENRPGKRLRKLT